MSQHTRRDQCPPHPRCRESRPARRALLVTLSLALGLIAAMVWLVGGPASPAAQAMPGDRLMSEQDDLDAGVIRVATTGEDIPLCGTEEDPCRTVQYAVDQALPGDEIRVAAGTYTDMDNLGDLRQIVYLEKSLTIRGGYTTANWTTPDPGANPTTLDAEGQGRVMVISPTITVHLEGLRFVGGDATGLGAAPLSHWGANHRSRMPVAGCTFSPPPSPSATARSLATQPAPALNVLAAEVAFMPERDR